MNHPDPIAGRPTRVMRHRDYLLEVPAWRYHVRVGWDGVPCGHDVFYRTRVPKGEYGYCRACRSYFLHDDDVTEYKPRRRSRTLSETELAELVDIAIVKNRVADLVVDVGGGLDEATLSTVMNITGAGRTLVFLVQADLGLNPDPIAERSVA